MPVSTASQPAVLRARGPVAEVGFAYGFSLGADLARSDRQPDASTAAQWTEVLATLGLSEVALVSQVHGDGIVEVDAPSGPLGTHGEADALLTTVPGLAVAVRVADCVPVLLAAPGAVAAVHAGWRGVAARIVPKSVARLVERVGCAPGDVQAIVGPSICGRHYEVGPEVVDALVGAGIPERAFRVPGRGPKPHVDGRCAVSWQLAAAGVHQVAHAFGCTWERPDLHSWRRDGARAGRLAGIIALRPA